MTKRLLPGLTALALTVALVGVAGPVPEAAAATGCRTASSDFDADGVSDLAVGAPGGGSVGGAVIVRLSNRGKPISVTLTGVPGFGTALTSLSSGVDADGEAACSQLVVGSPDEGAGGSLRGGVVWVYAWDARAKRFLTRGLFAPQSQGVDGTEQEGARFGAALAAEQRPVGTAASKPQRLWVGAPGTDVGTGVDSGQVLSFTIEAREDPSAYDTESVQLGEPLTDEPTARAQLGTSIAVAGGLVAIGAPGASAAAVRSAGAVLIDTVDPGPDSPLPAVLTQNTPGVPGTAETGDRFGASVHLVPVTGRGPVLLAGAPGEDVGSRVDAGSVTVGSLSPTTFRFSGTVRTLTQDSDGMAGTAEAGDQLGASVSSARIGSTTRYLVGVPGEDVGTVRDAGLVQAVGTDRGWTQDTTGVPGTAEPGDRMGAALGRVVSTGRALTGVPGEDARTGRVLVGLPGDGSPVTSLAGPARGSGFGSTLLG